MRFRPLTALLAVLVVTAPITPIQAADPSASPGTGGASPAPAAEEIPGGATDFGDYVLVPLLSDTPAYAGPPTPHSLDGVLVSSEVRRLLKDPRVEKALLRKGFVIVPAELPVFSMAYDSQAYSGTPVFVTTDVAYDTWHLVFDKVLRQVETQELLPKLAELIGGMLERARAQASDLAGTRLEDPAGRVVQLLQVAGQQLGLEVGKLGPLARAERRLIGEHDQLTRSPLLGTDIDYSLFTPRGHYTRSKELTRYFVAMSVLGQMAFALPGAVQNDGSTADASGLRLGTLVTRTLVGDTELEDLWRAIYEPTAFLVGMADDYTPVELAAAVQDALPGAMADPAALADDAAMAAVSEALTALRPVRIDAERPAVRLMGTRFVVDSWVMDQLLAPYVGTLERPRLIPSPLDLAAAFGSDFAYRIQEGAGETAYEGYEGQMAALREAVAARPDEDWGSTVYDAWLAAIEPMWLPHGAAYPDFMRTKAWSAKDQQTGFGSYTELKHDTILYTKQAVGEMGAAEPARVPRHWVEPDPVPFARLQAMADLARAGLASRGLLPRELRRLLADFSDLAAFLSRIAADELAGRPISKDDNARLDAMGGSLESFWWRTSDAPAGAIYTDEMSALVADIASGRDQETGAISVVEVGTGYVDRILVLVPDDRGRFQVAEGGVYSYYEFLQPVSDRLTDEAWRSMLRSGEAPARPKWIAPAMH